ncbi:hypothetical protein SAMN05446935_8028 [Burkholderia sp. YR290]|nr:hypothetical protein SAMN05446935_8028 [Burkholderia sp. YR290]
MRKSSNKRTGDWHDRHRAQSKSYAKYKTRECRRLVPAPGDLVIPNPESSPTGNARSTVRRCVTTVERDDGILVRFQFPLQSPLAGWSPFATSSINRTMLTYRLSTKRTMQKRRATIINGTLHAEQLIRDRAARGRDLENWSKISSTVMLCRRGCLQGRDSQPDSQSYYQLNLPQFTRPKCITMERNNELARRMA